MKFHEAQLPIAIASASGPWLHDESGKRYLDGISSWWVNLFGHGHPHIKAALHDQLERLDHVMLAGFAHAPVVELSERLARLTGLGHAFYGSDRASATEIALKMSAHYWRNIGRTAKCRFAGLAGGYHGETVGAFAVTDVPLFREAYAPLVRLAATERLSRVDIVHPGFERPLIGGDFALAYSSLGSTAPCQMAPTGHRRRPASRRCAGIVAPAAPA